MAGSGVVCIVCIVCTTRRVREGRKCERVRVAWFMSLMCGGLGGSREADGWMGSDM